MSKTFKQALLVVPAVCIRVVCTDISKSGPAMERLMKAITGFSHALWMTQIDIIVNRGYSVSCAAQPS